jgi:hypothetical protein
MATNLIVEYAKRFEELCIAILKERGVDDETSILAYQNPNTPDFVGIDRVTKALVIGEFKLSLSGVSSSSSMRYSIAQLKDQVDWYRDEYEKIDMLLITTSRLSSNAMEITRTLGMTIIWDLPKLLDEASQTSVYQELLDFLSEVGVGDIGTQIPDSVDQITAFDSTAQKRNQKGMEFIKRLDVIPEGSDGWRKFEQWCTEVVGHLFGRQFGFSQPQGPSDHGMHRRDLLVRLRPSHDFWTALAHDFRSRYVLFEFKNYEHPIGQDEIYSTEKYLFTTALRSVCFIIARNGANENANSAASGALREAGKLIIILDIQEVRNMLAASDDGQEPEILLHKRLDDALTKMLR